MTRSNPSALDLALVAAVRKIGFTISPTQLERWRTQLWLARATDWTDPQTGEIRSEIVHRAACLANASQPGRSISWLGWIFWAIDETPEIAARLRAAVADALERPLRRAGLDIGQVPERDSDEAFDARREMAAVMLRDRRCPRLDFDGSLRAGAAPQGPDGSGRSDDSRRYRRRRVRGVDGGVGGFLAEQVEHMRTAHRDAALAGVDLFAQSP
ncbi:hypothetical protein AB0K74_43765 [Streptomyces sp. NPDC056159]|uniref:hypothetical protein n=1 Tax=unclassified Streptomyces TaxID=2593676 RepID=UPI00342068D8